MGCHAVAYAIAQFAGGTSGMLLASATLSAWLGHPEVNYVVTVPGTWGAGVAWLAEFSMTSLLMSTVLVVSNAPSFARFTGLAASACVFLFITFESPLSGMSLNPARSFASALIAPNWTAFWVYVTAPPAGMLAAAAAFSFLRGRPVISCAKIHHQNPYRCIFCEYQRGRSQDRRLIPS